MKLPRQHILSIAAAAALFATSPARTEAAISISGAGLVYSQNFDSLTATTLSSTTGAQVDLGGLQGWQAAKIAGTGTTAMPFSISSGSGNSGGIYSFGAASATDRALGTLASGSNVPAFGVAFTNDTGVALGAADISFTAEFWRSSTSTQNALKFAYGLSGGSVGDANYLSSADALSFATLNVTGPAAVATNGALDGNLPENQSIVSAHLAGLLWEPGQTLYLRWQDFNDVGNDAGLALDNFSLSVVAIPEPSAYAALLGATALGLALRRRKATA